MSISFVGAQGNAGTTVTIPTHQVGDMILIFAYRDGSNTAPTTPTAGGTVPTWTQISSAGANTNSANFRYAVATATTTTSGTWTNATEIICLVYRGTKLVGVNGVAGGNGSSISYPALTLQRTDGSSWVVGCAGHRTATNVEQVPTGMTHRVSSGTEAAGHDTNGVVSSWSLQTVTVNASSGWRGVTVELRDATVVLTADKGVFTETGNDATLTKASNKVLVSEKGTYSLTGVAADLLHAVLLTAEKGTITEAGNDAGILLSAKLVASAGSFALVGNVIDIHYVAGNDFNVDPGHFTLTGNDAGIRRSVTFAAGPVSYTISGSNASFSKPFILVASPRTFNVTGRAVSLLYSGATAEAKLFYYQLHDIESGLGSAQVNSGQLVYYINNYLRVL